MVTTDKLLITIDRYLRESLSYKRYRHSVSTAVTAEKLCARFNENQVSGYIAGLIHDMARELDEDEMMSLALKDGGSISDLEKKEPLLLHGRAGAVLCREKFGIRDPEILEAVSLHTTGNAGMCNLSRIVFIADYIEPYRKHMTEEYMIMLEGKSLDNMVKIVLNSVVEYLLRESRTISDMTLSLAGELADAG